MNIDKKQIIQQLLKQNGAQAILLYSPQNRYWYSRFRSSMGYLLITSKSSSLFLDGRYITMARECNDLQNTDNLNLLDNNIWKKIQTILKEEHIDKVAFESDWMSYQDYLNFQDQLPDIQFLPINTYKVREIKDAWEIQQVKKACDITDLVFKDVLVWVKPGISEKELSRYVSDRFLSHGVEKLSFDTIVASGINGSKPHAIPTNKKLMLGELITLDMGCYYNGYASDQTRTFALGEINDIELQKIYDVVYQAQALGISLLKPGVETGSIHEKVNQFINKQGYEGYFTHGLGHGLGIEIHEEPYESSNQKTLLKPGMIVTVEPGIYIPNLGGVRIEDDFLITERGAERLTSSVRELIKI